MVGGLWNSLHTSLHRTLRWGLNLPVGRGKRLRSTETFKWAVLPLSVVEAGGNVCLSGISEAQFAFAVCSFVSQGRSRVNIQSGPNQEQLVEHTVLIFVVWSPRMT